MFSQPPAPPGQRRAPPSIVRPRARSSCRSPRLATTNRRRIAEDASRPRVIAPGHRRSPSKCAARPPGPAPSVRVRPPEGGEGDAKCHRPRLDLARGIADSPQRPPSTPPALGISIHRIIVSRAALCATVSMYVLPVCAFAHSPRERVFTRALYVAPGISRLGTRDGINYVSDPARCATTEQQQLVLLVLVLVLQPAHCARF